MHDWEEREALRQRAEQARSRAFAKATEFSMGQPDFGADECRKILRMGFDSSDAAVYTQALGWLAEHGEAGPSDAKRLAIEAYFSLRPSAMGAVCERWPEAFDERVDGLDFFKSGLAMAIIQGEVDAAVAFSLAAPSLANGEERARRAFEEGQAACARAAAASGDDPRSQAKARELIVRCEAAMIAAVTKAAVKGGPQRPSMAL